MKMRVNRGQEFVIGGYTHGTRTFDALIFGYYEGERLIYAARTRNGFTPADARRSCSGSCGRSKSTGLPVRESARKPRADAGASGSRRRRWRIAAG